jgi:serine/threonine-protein kinase 24/25/MST4
VSSSPGDSLTETAPAEPHTPTAMDAPANHPPPAYPGLSSRSQRRSSWSARNNPNGTIINEADVGNGMDTLRPVKKLDSAGSLRLSSDFVGNNNNNNNNNKSPSSPTSMTHAHARHTSEYQRAGSAMVSEVIVPTIQLAIRDDMEAREIEALSMLSKGFEDLREANPELAYNLVLDILTGINECVFLASGGSVTMTMTMTMGY